MRRPISSIGATVFLCVLSASAGLACGGSDEEQKVRAAIERGLTRSDPDNCEELVTERFIAAVYRGSIAACRADAASGERAESVQVSKIEIEGDAASAEAISRGDRMQIQAIRFELVREDGEWKLDSASIGGRPSD